MEEAPEKGKELSHSAHANGMNTMCVSPGCVLIFYSMFNLYEVCAIL